jgi:hypothetical protein
VCCNLRVVMIHLSPLRRRIMWHLHIFFMLLRFRRFTWSATFRTLTFPLAEQAYSWYTSFLLFPLQMLKPHLRAYLRNVSAASSRLSKAFPIAIHSESTAGSTSKDWFLEGWDPSWTVEM